MEKVYRIDIHLADDEWGSELMAKLAREALLDPQNADKQPLVVMVHEHAGWALGWAVLHGEPTICYSANDAAAWPWRALEFREEAYRAEWVRLTTIRRAAGGKKEVA